MCVWGGGGGGSGRRHWEFPIIQQFLASIYNRLISRLIQSALSNHFLTFIVLFIHLCNQKVFIFQF